MPQNGNWSIKLQSGATIDKLEQLNVKYKDKRELSKFIMALTTSPAEITITNKAYYVKLSKLEPPQYQKSAELLIEKLNMLQSTIMDGSGRKLIFQF